MKIQKEMGTSFRNACIWGPSARFDGQQVRRDHPVQDGEIVEIVEVEAPDVGAAFCNAFDGSIVEIFVRTMRQLPNPIIEFATVAPTPHS